MKTSKIKQIKKEWFQLTNEEREIVKTADKKELFFEDYKKFAREPLSTGFLIIENDKIKVSDKYIEFKKSRLPKNINLSAIIKRVRDGLSTEEEALFELETFKERIESTIKEVKEVKKIVDNCEHSYTPYRASTSTDILNRRHYLWVYQCDICKKEHYETTKTKEEQPLGFEDIKLDSELNLL